MTTKPFIQVTFTPKNPDKVLKKIFPIFQDKWEKEMKDFAKKSEKIFRSKIPVGKKRRVGRRGTTRASIKAKTSLKKRTMEGVINMRGNEVVKFLDKGTRSSPGRYVPILNRRIRSGFHPGVRPLNIIQDATKDIENDTSDRIRKLRKEFDISIKEAFSS